MASSNSTNPNNLIELLQRDLRQQITLGDRLTVALSGGVDSVVLLDILAKLSGAIEFNLSAVHVEHGISSHSDQWRDFCQKLCDKFAISLSVFRLQISKQARESLEATARHARYQAFTRVDTDYIVLAQHQDDQAETLLLQLLRGAGIKGLSAMPAVRPLANTSIKLLRPLLNTPRTAILHYAQTHNLAWVNDESNANTDFDRNYLRHKVFPIIETRYPAYRKTLARTCRHLGEATRLLDELAQADGEQIMTHHTLSLRKLRSLNSARAKNLLRYFLAQKVTHLPSAAKLGELLHQLCTATADNYISFPFENMEIRCYRGVAECLPINSEAGRDFIIPWQGERQLFIEPLQGTLIFQNQSGTGIDLQKLSRQTVTIRTRSGGEKFQPDCKRPRRSLKKIFQETAFPPWKRNALPLLFCADTLVWVADIGTDCHFQAPSGAPGLDVTWLPAESTNFKNT
ncbi:MAG: tRNA lysidine(34) synthetase TilS [Nitrosomonas sp.]|nr:tRNA lysidine(34) synthetase TilS [Nitrosomonas sp.]